MYNFHRVAFMVIALGALTLLQGCSSSGGFKGNPVTDAAGYIFDPSAVQGVTGAFVSGAIGKAVGVDDEKVGNMIFKDSRKAFQNAGKDIRKRRNALFKHQLKMEKAEFKRSMAMRPSTRTKAKFSYIKGPDGKVKHLERYDVDMQGGQDGWGNAYEKPNFSQWR